MKTSWIWILALTLSAWSGQRLASQDPAKLDAGRVTSGEFRPDRFGPARWLDGEHYATLERQRDGVPELVRYEAVSGAREVLVSAAMLRVESR